MMLVTEGMIINKQFLQCIDKKQMESESNSYYIDLIIIFFRYTVDMWIYNAIDNAPVSKKLTEV